MNRQLKIAMIITSIFFLSVVALGFAMMTLAIPAQFHRCATVWIGMSDNRLWQVLGVFVSACGFLGFAGSNLILIVKSQKFDDVEGVKKDSEK